MRKLTGTLCVLALAAPAAAQSQSWINPGTGDWFAGSNWSNGVAPAASSGIASIIDNAGAAQIAAGSASALGLTLAHLNDAEARGEVSPRVPLLMAIRDKLAAALREEP